MGVINIIAKFVGTDVQTGLERLDAQAQKFKTNLSKNLSSGSLSGMLTTLAAGFGALQIKDTIVAGFREMAENAERAAEASERMRDAVNTSIKMNTNAEGKVQNKKNQTTGDTGELKRVNNELADVKKGVFGYDPDYEESNRIPVITAAFEAMDHSLAWVLGKVTGQKSRYDKLIASRDELGPKVTAASGELTAEQREINTANRQTGYAAAQARDEGLVMRGRISATEAQRRLIGDLGREYDATLNDPTKSEAQRATARIAVARAETALIPMQVREDQSRIQGVMPQISASSLAKIGGGGNVNVFGGREGALETEARLHTQLLRAVVANTAKGSANSNDVQ